MTEELKLCPFCGAAPETYEGPGFHAKEETHAIQCSNAACEIQPGIGTSPRFKASNIAAWNGRADRDAEVRELNETILDLQGEAMTREEVVGGLWQIAAHPSRHSSGVIARVCADAADFIEKSQTDRSALFDECESIATQYAQRGQSKPDKIHAAYEIAERIRKRKEQP